MEGMNAPGKAVLVLPQPLLRCFFCTVLLHFPRLRSYAFRVASLPVPKNKPTLDAVMLCRLVKDEGGIQSHGLPGLGGGAGYFPHQG